MKSILRKQVPCTVAIYERTTWFYYIDRYLDKVFASSSCITRTLIIEYSHNSWSHQQQPITPCGSSPYRYKKDLLCTLSVNPTGFLHVWLALSISLNIRHEGRAQKEAGIRDVDKSIDKSSWWIFIVKVRLVVFHSFIFWIGKGAN